jgi:spore coat polysaccharide biosynthesis protein SpsF
MNEQERFWQGEFGDEYLERNRGGGVIAGNIALFAEILKRAEDVKSVLEFGAGTGNNLQAIKMLLPGVGLFGVEINKKAGEGLSDIANTYIGSVFEPCSWHGDFVLSKGLLIHIEPSMLPVVYDTLYSSSDKYICLVEYYNPVPVEVPYRGHTGKLWKRDFAGEMLDRYPLKLIDYGFVYHRDKFKQDDVHWWLMQK